MRWLLSSTLPKGVFLPGHARYAGMPGLTRGCHRPNIQAMIGNEFFRRSSRGLTFYGCTALEGLAHVRHGFSTRADLAATSLGSSLNLSPVPWDSRERVAGNRRRFLEALGLGSARLQSLSQIHSDRVHIIEESSAQGNLPREGDALATSQKGLALGVFVADCFPVLLADPSCRAVAAVHSGWRGTAGQIVDKTVATMHEALAADPSRMIAAIGPGIRSCCFEVGLDVADLFEKRWPASSRRKSPADRPGKAFLDLALVLRLQLVSAGLDPDNIFDLGLCTRCNPEEFFSYRGEGVRAGRLMAVIGSIGE